jgi:hypothetical protein
MKDLKDLKEKCQRLEAELAEKQKFVADLKPRIVRLGNELVAATFALETAERKTGALVADITQQKRSEQDLKTHYAAIAGLRDEVKAKEQILQSLVQEEKASGENLRKLVQSLSGAKYVYWYTIFLLEREKVLKSGEGMTPLLRCLGALRLSGDSALLSTILLRDFEEGLSEDLIRKIKISLVKDYGGDKC